MRGGRDESGGYDVQSTYFPAQSTGYTPPQPSTSDPFAQAEAPFGSSNMVAGNGMHSSASSSHHTPEVVPAVMASESAPHAGVASGDTVLRFQESNLPTYGISGKVGSTDVPRVQSYAPSASLLGAGAVPSAGGSDNPNAPRFSMFNMKSYRKYFNVDTQDVLIRMRDSVVGALKPDFFEKTTDNADLYGPFWIATTLVFVTAVTGNYASYVSHNRAQGKTGSETQAWYYDIDKVGYSAIVFYGYVGVIGLALWAMLKWWFKSEVGLVQVWCIYGYALSIFIPISFVCVLPYEALRWAMIGVATVSSGLFLLLNFKGPIFDVAGAKALPVWLGLGALHLGLGLALKLYFFQYWRS
ncbi:hypothetical protein CVIRNUC_007560 [Coccomyxa viridis]|uniref:Protein YIP n=1 Tax=Coccomyxa viridis TaxID=1274662 RepID=A0AAV1ICA2_9CHLO|nr:hypothetical protein CVIRNUC_007560 [Coccomyxa viridis]